MATIATNRLLMQTGPGPCSCDVSSQCCATDETHYGDYSESCRYYVRRGEIDIRSDAICGKGFCAYDCEECACRDHCDIVANGCSRA